MVYLEKPAIFNPIFEVVSCYLERDGAFLLLHRQDNKPEGDCWGLPAGKVDEGESLAEAMKREIKEETGQDIAADQLSYIGKVFVQYPEYDFIYHMYKTVMDQEPVITLSDREHKEYQWKTPESALDLKLVRGLSDCIKMSYAC